MNINDFTHFFYNAKKKTVSRRVPTTEDFYKSCLNGPNVGYDFAGFYKTNRQNLFY